MFAEDVKTIPSFWAGQPHRLFERIYEKNDLGFGPYYDVTADGQRFIMVKTVEDTSSSSRINVIVNWQEELKQRVPTR